MRTVELTQNVDYSLDGVQVVRGKKGDRATVSDDLADSLVASGYAKESRKRTAPIETPEKPSDQ